MQVRDAAEEARSTAAAQDELLAADVLMQVSTLRASILPCALHPSLNSSLMHAPFTQPHQIMARAGPGGCGNHALKRDRSAAERV